MKLFEYQAKELFRTKGIPVPNGVVISGKQEVQEAVEKVGLPCVVKSQILRGGRGKMGLVKLAKSKEQAQSMAGEMLNSEHNVHKLLIEQCLDIEKELYVSISMDAVSAKIMIIACAQGGVDIETIAKAMPEKIVREYVHIERGLQKFQLSQLVFKLGISHGNAKPVANLIQKLYDCFCQYDAELAEINPVIITSNGVFAGDGKFIIDDNSSFRQPKFELTRAHFSTDMEYESALEGIPYIQFDGDISLMCAGAGLTTTVYDLIHYEKGTVANYLEFGGPNYMKGEKAMEICLKNPSKVILIVTFGTIARADVIAEGVVNACKKLKPDRPLVTCIRGTNEEAAEKMLKDIGIECFTDTEDAVRRAVDLSS